MKRLTDTEAKTLYLHLLKSSEPMDVFTLILFETGARVSESLSLEARSLDGNSLSIPGLKGSDARIVRVSTQLVEKLRVLPHAGPWRKSIGDGMPQSQRRALCRHFRKLTSKLLGRPINLHALRHTAFSRLYLATRDLLLVKAWAGHRNIQSTMAYMHVDQREQADLRAAELLKNLAS
jgi:integrase